MAVCDGEISGAPEVSKDPFDGRHVCRIGVGHETADDRDSISYIRPCFNHRIHQRADHLAVQGDLVTRGLAVFSSGEVLTAGHRCIHRLAVLHAETF